MDRPNFSPVRKQLADHLREGISRGRWTGTMPGRDRLAHEMEINPKTVEAALNLLENEGLLASQGPVRRRKIVLPDSGLVAPIFRIAILQIYPNPGITYIDPLRRTLEDIADDILT
jgi:DNA-binding transcriptional MocR family regulator